MARGRRGNLGELGELLKQRGLVAPPRAPRAPAEPHAPKDETALFRNAVAGAVPLKAPMRHVPPHPRVPPIPVQSHLDDLDVLAELGRDPSEHEEFYDTGEEELYLRPGMGRDVIRKLRRLEWTIQAEVHLRLLTQPEAQEALARFLQECVACGYRCVRVIHGKGLNSRNREPVLKRRVKGWLARRDDVLAFCQAPPAAGGGGALIVLLKAG